MTILIVWRHGITAWNAGDRVQGQADTPLSERGRKQAETAAVRLAALRPAAIVTSDLSRAAETAGMLAALTDLPVRLDARLRERYYGSWQGMTITEIAEMHPVEYARWRAGEPDPGCGVETRDDMAKRVGAALRDAAELAPDGTVVVTTHGGVARIGVGELLGWPPGVTRALGGLGNCHWSELCLGSGRGWGQQAHHGWRLQAHNLSAWD